MTRDDVLRVLRRELTARGFVGRGRNFRVTRAEVAWLVQLELIPRTARVGVLLGVCPALLAPGGWPARANDCPIIFYPEGGGDALLGHDRWQVWQALDVDSELTDEARWEALVRLVEALVGAADRISSLDDLQAAFDLGQMTDFIRRDARALLGGDGATD